MRVLVTGGAGFIGSHTTPLLLTAGHEVTVFDNLSKGRPDMVPPGASLIKGDLADEAATEEALAGHDAVIHLAAYIPVAVSVEQPVRFTENNVLNTVRLLESMRRQGVRRIVFSSSATVYGLPQSLPIREEDPLGVQSNPYGATKIASEAFIAVYNQIHGFHATMLRFFNPFGSNELCEPETHVVPNIVRAAILRQPIPLFWKGEQVRDYIYVADFARALVAVLALDGLNYFNVGTDTGTRVRDIIDKVAAIVGYELLIDDRGERPGDIPASYASSERLRKATGWAPITGFDEGLRLTVEHYRERLKAAERP